jgi:hypothetical protein
VTSRLGRARHALRDALVGGTLPDERVYPYPQTGQYAPPCAWVGLPTVRAGRGSTTVTIPAVILVDGAQREQAAALDEETARAWDALRKVTVDGVKANVVSAGPDTFGPEGSTTLGVVLTVSLELATLTLCDAPQLVDEP